MLRMVGQAGREEREKTRGETRPFFPLDAAVISTLDSRRCR